MAARDIKFSPVPQMPLELAIWEWMGEEENDQEPTKSKQINIKKEEKNVVDEQKSVNLKSAETTASHSPSTTHNSSKADLKEVWPQVLEAIKPYNHTLEALLKDCEPNLLDEDGTLHLNFRYQFHYDRVREPENLNIVNQVITEVAGQEWKIVCQLNTEISSMKSSGFHGNGASYSVVADSPQKKTNSSGSVGKMSDRMNTSPKSADLIDKAMKDLGGKIIE